MVNLYLILIGPFQHFVFLFPILFSTLATFKKKLKNFVLKTARKDALRASTRLPAPCYDYADNDLQGTATHLLTTALSLTVSLISYSLYY